ncbi:MAG: DNA polymerase III subunit alpha [Deltaproteobacteria bacterium]|nr:DNA polymerase III subunit alpha [Deltaproteobacteria bacterium]
MELLSVHSHFSLMAGTASPNRLCRKAKRLGYRRLALTDTDNLYGLWPFLEACREEGITPIIGAAVTDPQSKNRAVCLVENATGYRNLCRLITRRHCDGTFDLKTALPGFSEGLIVLAWLPEWLCFWHETGVTVAAALRRGFDAEGWALRDLSRRLGIPFLAAPEIFFCDPGDFAVHRLLRAIARNTAFSRLTDADTARPDAFLTPPADYAQRFHLWPDALAAADALAERLVFTGPDFGVVLPPWSDLKGRPAPRALRESVYAGARKRYGDDLPETVVERLEHELSVIETMGFSGYFLVVQDIVKKSPRICGRGSGAASLVAYCLGITNVCPVAHNLYFERFLNPGRKDPPDIDVDFAWDERDAVIDAVLRQYAGHSAMVCSHVAFQPRMALRETAKVFGLTEAEIGRVSKHLPWFWRVEDAGQDLLAHIRNMPVFGGFDFSDPWPEILGLAQRIIGIPRHLSVHSGGVVITPDPIENYVPVEIAPKGIPVIQWEKDGTEKSGMVKIDLLGNRSLGVIRDAAANLAENGIPLNEARWNPEADPATRKTVAEGRTMGCFYIESPAMRVLQKKAGKGDFEHLVIHSSIIRPAANEFIREYLRRLHGASWKPVHPLLEDVLDDTFGIMVYQEDVSRTAVALAGFSHVEADGLRKILSKKDKVKRLKDYRRRFFEGAARRGVSTACIEVVWEMMESFAGYSFCKPHSASYARVSFQAAYLKTHFPAEFMAAVISNQGGFYTPFAYVSEARRMGLRVLPPDINDSGIRWKGKGKDLRVGFLSVSGLGRATREKIVEKRKSGPYRNLPDFLDRVWPETPEAQNLIHAGAFDALYPRKSRAALLWELAEWEKSRMSKTALFSGDPLPFQPVFPPDDEIRRLRNMYNVLGFLCDGHPLTVFFDVPERCGIVKAKDLHRHVGKNVRLAGLWITGKRVHTRHGEPMEFVTFEDDTGLFDTVFFPEAYRRSCRILDKSRPFLLSGKVEEEFGALTVTVHHVSAHESPWQGLSLDFIDKNFLFK